MTPHRLRGYRRGVLALVALLALAGCGTPQIPPQPASGVVVDYAGDMSLVSSTPLTAPGSRGLGRLDRYADGTVAIGGLPWFHQGKDRTCAQAAIAGLLIFWGHRTSYRQVVAEMNPGNWPTTLEAVVAYLKGRGLKADAFPGATLALVKRQIDTGRPVMVLLDYGALQYVHYVTVKGYNDATSQLIISDPVNGPNYRLSYARFRAMWQNRSLGVFPQLHDRYEQLAITVDGPEQGS